MFPWQVRPSEVANLLNPAFCALLLYENIFNFHKEHITQNGLPYPLSLLVLPIILHKSTRETLPKTISPVMSDWIQQNSYLIIGLAERVNRLIPFTKESLIFGMQKKAFDVAQDGNLVPLFSSLPEVPVWLDNSEVVMCRKCAGLLGRWFARSGSTSAIFRQLGIRL